VWRRVFVANYKPRSRWFEAITENSRFSWDGATIIDGGAAAFLGVLPSGRKIVAAVRDRLKP
jgi:hypothetical protein